MATILLKQILSEGVRCRVASTVFRVRPAGRRALVLLVLVSWGAFAARAAVRDVPGPMFSQIVPPRAAEATPAAPPKPQLDELVYKDGDRVRGRFVERVGDMLVFRSERFGLLEVPAAEAEVTLAKAPEPAIAAVVEQDDKADVEVERWPFSPLEMAQALQEFFGAWHGRFSVGVEILQDVADHNSATVDTKLLRKWKDDEVQLNARYEYAAVNEKASTDMVRGDALWRHELPGKFFAVYRPTVEWNRAFYRNGLPADYILLQQELGVGINLLDADTRKVRVGVSENVFDTWVTPTGMHFSQMVESLFAEVEAKLPWRITLTNRGVWYYSISDQTQGWENRFEISKKLTETVTIAARHDTRNNNPDVRSADYQRLRVLFGFDF